MELILIRPNLLELVKQGKKTTTIRKGIRTYPLEKTILQSNESDDAVYINILGLKSYKITDITDEDAKSDGFENVENLKSVLQDIYGDITDDTDLTLVSFELTKE